MPPIATTTKTAAPMSNYHLMRNFTALLRMLGYPRFISLENFRRPNFFLSADILVYLLKRFDSSLELNAKIDTEQERLAFVRTASQLMASKAHLDINTKNLYMADVNAVHEMIKLAKLIYDAWLAIKNRKEFEDVGKLEDGSAQSDLIENNQLDRTVYNNFKTNSLTSEILQIGTQLYDILGTEETNKNQRQSILGKQLVVEQIESTIRQSIQMLQEEIVTLQEQRVNLDQDNEDLDVKIEKKYAELNRNKKRQQTLYSQRPVFVDELEKVEQEIVQLYDTYVVNCRCLFFLEQKLEEFEEAEKLKIDERNEDIKQMLEQMRVDEFLKEGKVDGLTRTDSDQLIQEDDYGMIADLDDDEEESEMDGGLSNNYEDNQSGSDRLMFQGEQDINNKLEDKPRGPNNKVNQRKMAAEKKERLLLANTVTVTQRSKQQQRSSKTARLYSFGSLAEDDDDDDDDEEEGLSKSEEIAKMTDSDIDLDAIESDDEEDDDESVSLSIELNQSLIKNKNKIKPNNNKTNGNVSIGNSSEFAKLSENLDKSDDNF